MALETCVVRFKRCFYHSTIENRVLYKNGVKKQIRTFEIQDYRGDYRKLTDNINDFDVVIAKNGEKEKINVRLEFLSGKGNAVYRLVELK